MSRCVSFKVVSQLDSNVAYISSDDIGSIYVVIPDISLYSIHLGRYTGYKLERSMGRLYVTAALGSYPACRFRDSVISPIVGHIAEIIVIAQCAKYVSYALRCRSAIPPGCAPRRPTASSIPQGLLAGRS